MIQNIIKLRVENKLTLRISDLQISQVWRKFEKLVENLTKIFDSIFKKNELFSFLEILSQIYRCQHVPTHAKDSK